MSTVKSRKAKARKLQNQIRDLILASFPLLPGDVKPALMGEQGSDIKLSPRGKELFPFSVECKNDENISIWRTWLQCKTNTEKDTMPLAFMGKNYHETLAILSAADLFRLLSLISEGKSHG